VSTSSHARCPHTCSKGVIQPDFDPVRIAKAYEAGGAACLSVLTDEKFFQGCFDNLRLIRAAGVTCPLLCKEFIVEPYQLFKARAFGADAVLLIAAVLPNSDLRYLGTIAATLGMAVLVEVHTQGELARVMALHGVFPFMLGINNRDLGTFKVDLLLTARLLATPPGQQALRLGIPVVGESGIFTHEDLLLLRDVGVSAVLVGESIVKQADPRAGVRALYGRTDLQDECDVNPSTDECRTYE
jgi:indole-3-glycerol phosphate synthase